MIAGRVLITGGTGSLGQAIVRRAEADGWDASFTVYSRDEAKQAAMRARHPDVQYVCGDVRDYENVVDVMQGMDVVIHAAAYKRVPEAEVQPRTYADTNVNGSLNVVRAATRLGTPIAIAISTDKACESINSYGATKRLMEGMFQAAVRSAARGQRFTLTRYGNVLASTGSVVPTFRALAAKGGPLPLIDPTWTRFWLTLDDAVELVVGAADVPSGCILVPKPRASSMAVMAEAIAPGVPTVTALNRGAEKDHESLMNRHEAPYAMPWRWQGRTGFVLSPMFGEPKGILPNGFALRSNEVPQFTVEELRAVIASLDGRDAVRTL